MAPPLTPPSKALATLNMARMALREWRMPQVLVALGVTVAVGLSIGLATVLIPNPVFSRDIPTVWWNYPVWILSSGLMGVLVATYVAPPTPTQAQTETGRSRPSDARGAGTGTVAGVLAWFAVGCPVCNKLALLALGYTGALTWFAPVQPLLAAASLLLATVAVVWRLKGQISCRVPSRTAAAVAEAR